MMPLKAPHLDAGCCPTMPPKANPEGAAHPPPLTPLAAAAATTKCTTEGDAFAAASLMVWRVSGEDGGNGGSGGPPPPLPPIRWSGSTAAVAVPIRRRALRGGISGGRNIPPGSGLW